MPIGASAQVFIKFCMREVIYVVSQKSACGIGTGSVGLEALSRGAEQACFVELDPWVQRSVLQPNIAACGQEARSTMLGGKAEAFLERCLQHPPSAPPPFDLIRYVCTAAYDCCRSKTGPVSCGAAVLPQHLRARQLAS